MIKIFEKSENQIQKHQPELPKLVSVKIQTTSVARTLPKTDISRNSDIYHDYIYNNCKLFCFVFRICL